MRTVEQIITEMLLENTGKHFLDSGRDNGRQWQRNQGRDFESEPEVTAEFRQGMLEYVTVSVYHFLTQVLEVDDYSEGINKILEDSRRQGEDAHWVQDCMEIIEGLPGIENVKGPFNTYNWYNHYSQEFQYMTFTKGEEAYVLLQIHGGADVRGGYTDTVCFRLEAYLAGVDINGSVNGIGVDTMHDGLNLTTAEGEEIEVSEDDDYYFEFLPAFDSKYLYFE